MAAKVDKEKFTGCGICVDVCPNDLVKITMKYPCSQEFM